MREARTKEHFRLLFPYIVFDNVGFRIRNNRFGKSNRDVLRILSALFRKSYNHTVAVRFCSLQSRDRDIFIVNLRKCVGNIFAVFL